MCEAFDVSSNVFKDIMNNVFIAGREVGDKFLGTAFIYKIQTSVCIQLDSLRVPRAFIGLFYFKRLILRILRRGSDFISA